MQIFDLIKLGGWWDVLLMEMIEGRADLEGRNHSQVRGLLMPIVYPHIDVDCTEDIQFSPGNRSVEVIVYG